ncbi:MAG: Tetratricopeptide repeat protein [Syntrophorhabdus sp. PtaU1.Bin058]|nr:MAG: Tetratricopeptide repeat protein [Syntrophorhabdus sp. PtaU1.Bin058]
MIKFLKNQNIFIFYVAVLYACVLYYLFQWPIAAGDTDLWYHLNSGRYFFENGFIPKDSYFSFIQPPREWVDYFWLFQVVVYKIYQFLDYYGLVFLRATVFATLSLFLFLFFFYRQGKERFYFFITIVFCLYVLLFMPRYYLVRPHIFTYLFMAMFLYILERRRERSFFLPVIAVFWMNLHGIVYPLMLLIIAAYLIETVYTIKRQKRKMEKSDLNIIVPLILSMAAIYATPHGSRITWMPFVPTGFASFYIQELLPLSFADLFTFNIIRFCPSLSTIFNILLILVIISFIVVICTKQVRISHLILFAGGIILLLKGNRFKYEFMLLSMPLMRAMLATLSPEYIKKFFPKPVNIILAACVLLIPFMCVKEIFSNSSRFPFSLRNLPHGIGVFLNKVNTGGAVLNYPDKGGYHQWMLYPRYKIFIDMEVPFLFTDEDFYIATSAYKNKLFLQKLIDQYDPSYITVPIKDTFFRDMMLSFKQYRVVFFDDCEVLYANQNRQPDIVSIYAIKTFDPFNLAETRISTIKTINDYTPIKNELLKMAEIYPDNGIANQCLAIFYSREGRYDEAIGYTDNIIRNYPESATGYTLKGDILQEMGRFNSAVENYKMALKRWDIAEIHRSIGMVYYKQKRFKDAYNTLVRTMDVYSSETTYKDLYFLIDSAIRIGKKREAEILFRYAYQSIPPSGGEWLKRYGELGIVMGQKILHK